MSSLVILVILVAVSALPVTSPIKLPAILPDPVILGELIVGELIVGEVKVLFVNICVVFN